MPAKSEFEWRWNKLNHISAFSRHLPLNLLLLPVDSHLINISKNLARQLQTRQITFVCCIYFDNQSASFQ
jgi:hypothetical protein